MVYRSTILYIGSIAELAAQVPSMHNLLAADSQF